MIAPTMWKRKMKRRNFIKIMAAGSCITMVSPFSGAYQLMASRRNLKNLDPKATDTLLRLISYAMQAPNSHNVQPWTIQIKGENRFDLFVDQERLLPFTDPPARQIHISQGTFIEYLRIAASAMGYKLEVDLFPLGEYSNQVIEDKPVASVRLIQDESIQEDPFYPWLLERQSNKRIYEDKPIPAKHLVEMESLAVPRGVTIRHTSQKELLTPLSDILGRAMAIEVTDLDRNKETVDIFRFSEEEALKHRDGFSLANNGVTGFKRFMAEAFFLGTREEAYAVDSAFSKEGTKMTYEQAKSAVAYGWIESESNSRVDQFKVGELYSGINLLTARQGVSMHPMSQVLQEYDDMKDLQKEFLELLDVKPGSTVQMLFRMGYAEPVPHTKRLFVNEITS